MPDNEIDRLSLTLKVDIIAGTSLEEGAKQLITLSERLGVMITSNFNGYHVIATESSDPEEIVASYRF